MQQTWIACLGCLALLGACGDDGSNHSGGELDAGGEHADDASSGHDGGSKTDAASGDPSDAGSVTQPGSCVPRGASSWSTLMKSAQSIADGLEGSYGFLGVAQGNIYLLDIVGNNGKTTVVRVAEAGGSPETVLTLDVEDARVLLGDSHLYYASPSDKTDGYPLRFRVPLANPAAKPESLGAKSPSLPLLIQGDTLYGYNATDGTFWQQSFADGALKTLGTRKGVEPTEFALVDGTLVFPNAAFGGESLQRLTLATGKVEQLSKGSDRTATPLLVNDGTAYWGGAGPLYATPLSAPSETQKLGFTSGIDSFSNLAREPEQLAVHGDRLYFVDEEASVSWVALDAKSCGGIVSTPLADSFNQSFYLSGSSLYILYQPNFEPGQVWRYPLP